MTAVHSHHTPRTNARQRRATLELAVFYRLVRPRAPVNFVFNKDFLRALSQTIAPATKLMRPISGFVLLLLVAATAVGAQPSSSTLEERMSQTEFRDAGLDKLSPAELAHLNGWLQAHGEGKVKYVSASGAPVFYPDTSARDTVEDHIAGTFLGWRGRTVFKLDNGQQWRQAESGIYDAGTFTHPKVKIKPMLLGSWLMYVDGCGCSVRVDRIR